MACNNFDSVYLKLLGKAIHGVEQKNKRTGTITYAYIGQCFKWDLDYLPLSNLRPMYLKTAAAEVAWKLSGRKSIKWLQQYTHIWDDFAEEDGQVTTAYGYRWRHAFGIDQVTNILKKLKEDPSSRQQLLLSWDPREDNIISAKNVPCPWASQFMILKNKLYTMLHVRSNDLFFGMPYDLMMYTLLAQAFANSLELDLGDKTYTIGNAHIYENQVPAVKALLDEIPIEKEYKARHSFTVEQISAKPDAFVSHILEIEKSLDYSPKNITKGLIPKVVL